MSPGRHPQKQKTDGGNMFIARTRRAMVQRWNRDVRGQSLVEFAIVASLLFLLIFGVIDFGRLFYTQETLQHALREAGRFAVTGQHLADPDKPGQTLSRIDSIVETAKRYALGIDVSKVTISSPEGGDTRPAGGPRETIVISLTSDLKLITPYIGQFFGPDGVYSFKVSTTFLNEPFDPKRSN